MTALIFFVHPVPVEAQDVDDFSAYMGYRGYTAHRQQVSADSREVGATYAAPVLIGDKYVYDDDNAISIDVRPKLPKRNVGEAPSRVEEFYRKRTGENDLVQFGYDLFYTAKQDGVAGMPLQTTPAGAVQDDYIVQAGDEVTVIFTGERKGRAVHKVGSDGRLIVDGLPPLMITGRTLAEVKKDARIALDEVNYYGDVDITISAIRQIGVLVAGYVFEPGRHNLNAYTSVLDALNIAGGVRKNGSLRNIKLVRNGSTQFIDLYNFITFNKVSSDSLLRDGDRIIVPPVGATIAVTGDVKQQGIFELLSVNSRSQSVTLSEALSMAGGSLGRGDYRFTMTRGNGDVVNVGKDTQAVIDDGAIVDVIRASDRLANGVELKGYSRRNGVYDLDSAGTLQELMADQFIFGDDTYPLIGVVSRVNRDSLTRNLMAFSPQAIAEKTDDRQLEAGDVVYLFSNSDIQNITNKNNNKNEYPDSIKEFVRDHVVRLSGAVHGEGEWPVGTVTDLQTLVSVAGGLTSKASRTDIEITSRNDDMGNVHQRRKIDAKDLRLSEVILEPGDQVRVNERYDQAVEKSVRITGEVKYPGNYDLMRGDTLLSLIERAGGLTPDAYAPAAVFSRKAERKREEQKFRTAAQELERTVSVNLNAKDQGASLTPAQISMARKLADDLRSVQAVGRVTVEADPAVLSVKPQVNMLLEDGDHLHIPKRSLNVRVTGEVMNPASLLFEDSKDADDYIRQAGGTTYFADKGRSFVVYPDGSAQPLERGWSSASADMIIPGSTIVIPRDPKPFDFMESFKDITQILSNMAITGVFIEDIANDEN